MEILLFFGPIDDPRFFKQIVKDLHSFDFKPVVDPNTEELTETRRIVVSDRL